MRGDAASAYTEPTAPLDFVAQALALHAACRESDIECVCVRCLRAQVAVATLMTTSSTQRTVETAHTKAATTTAAKKKKAVTADS